MKRSLPEWIRAPLRAARDFVRALPYSGSGRWCPVCATSSRRFLPFGSPPREDAMCPRCGALERHRLVWLFFGERTDLLDGRNKRVLHVAPEPCFERRLRKILRAGYVTADRANPRARVKMDVAAVPHPDECFDAIYCSHVLQYVPSDRQAMKEFLRVLKKDGWAVLLVPVTEGRTREDASIVDPGARASAFGREDQVRRYGPDFADRLREAGFEVAVIRAADLRDRPEVERMGLGGGGEIHYLRPAAPGAGVSRERWER
jgi:hypothetical protein